MKCLTICQPYGTLIMRRDKRVENRFWSTRYRGPMVIHAGKSRDWLDDCQDEYGIDPNTLTFGAILGVAKLIDCLHFDRIVRGEYDAIHPWLRRHQHTEGEWCWVLGDVLEFAQPIPYKGAQGLHEVPDEVIRQPMADAIAARVRQGATA